MEIKSKTLIYGGMLGGGIVIAVFIIIMLTMNLFNHRISLNKINIINAPIADTIHSIEKGNLIANQNLMKQEFIKQLNNDKVILTPQEYTNNVVSYYNNLILVLSVMLAAFSFLSFAYLKSWSRDLIQETLESEGFQEGVSQKLLGQAESNFREDIAQIQDEIENLKNKLIECCEKEEEDNINETEIV